MQFKRLQGKPQRYTDHKVSFDPRYEEQGIGLGFWETLDSKLFNWTAKFPWLIRHLFRFILCVLNMNHRNPMPIGNNEEIGQLWNDYPKWVRYLLWRLRNPWEDLRKLYLGFGYAFYSDKLWYVDLITYDKFKIWVYAPYKIPIFPHLEAFIGKWELDIGFKKRGLFSISFRES